MVKSGWLRAHAAFATTSALAYALIFLTVLASTTHGYSQDSVQAAGRLQSKHPRDKTRGLSVTNYFTDLLSDEIVDVNGHTKHREVSDTLSYLGREFSSLLHKNVTFLSEKDLERFVQAVRHSDVLQPHPEQKKSVRHKRAADSVDAQATRQPVIGKKTLRRRTHSNLVIELLIVFDVTMIGINRSERELEKYYRVVGSIVNKYYNASSLGTPVEVSVVEVQKIEVKKIVDSVEFVRLCKAIREGKSQALEHNLLKNRPLSYDVAAVITREAICNIHYCNILGLATRNYVCTDSPCVVVKDTGLVGTANTIAHEIGHLLGMVHDDEDSPLCNLLLRHSFTAKAPPRSVRSHIMGNNLQTQHVFHSWSDCSRETLAFYLNLPGKECLGNTSALTQQQLQKEKNMSQLLPGEIYDGDKQCKMRHPSYIGLCSDRRCSLDCVNDRGKCEESITPLADGTTCDEHKWCIEGKCTYINTPETYRQDGGWTGWTPWSPCSLTCGLGISRRRRECKAPSPNWGGKMCPGSDAEFRTCLVEHCPQVQTRRYFLESFTREQCVEATSRSPSKIPMSVECMLPCERMKPRDGTPCNLKSSQSSICVDGRCHFVGCDGELNSTESKVDSCGICGGNNTQCYRKNYNTLPAVVKPGKNTLFNLKVTMNNVTIHYIKPMVDEISTSFWHQRMSVMLHSSKYNVSVKRDDYFGLNFEETYQFAGMTIKYIGRLSRTDTYAEEIITLDRVKTQMEVQLHYRGIEQLTINHHYHLNIDYTLPLYYWVKHYGNCSQLCMGKQVMQYACYYRNDTKYIRVANGHCENAINTPARRSLEHKERECNKHCNFQWTAVPITNVCPVTRCGTSIMQVFKCVALNVYSNAVITELANTSACGPPPDSLPEPIHCTGSCLPVKYNYSQWSSCTISCPSYKVRKVSCIDTDNYVWPLTECARLGKPVHQIFFGCNPYAFC